MGGTSFIKSTPTEPAYLFGRPLLFDSITIQALFGALFFTVHPTHIESVAWLASRKDKW